MLLIETALKNKSRIIASQYADEDVRKEYLQLAEDLRFPYWNWAADSVQKSGVPDILTNETVVVYAPPDNKPETIRNPLAAFQTSEPVGSPRPCQGCNPYDRPFVLTSEAGYPWLPKGYMTTRYPNVNNQTQVGRLNTGVRAESLVDWQEMLYGALLQGNWTYFSNHGAVPNGTIENGSFTFNNIESTHDSVHIGLGQNGGQISYTQIAAYDPIFFLHHGMVDYVLAVWQELHPDEWVTPNVLPSGTLMIEPGSMIGETTPLAPFFAGNGSTSNPFYTAQDLRNWTALGYTFKTLEMVKDLPQKEKTDALLRLFKPAGDDFKYRWYVALPNTTAVQAAAPFAIRVFVAAPYTINATEDTTSPYYAGSIWAWGATPITRTLGRQSVDITTNLVDQNIVTTVMPLPIDPSSNSIQPLENVRSAVQPSDLQFAVVSTTGEDFAQYVTNLDEPLIYYQALTGTNQVITRETYPESKPLGKPVDESEMAGEGTMMPESPIESAPATSSSFSLHTSLMMVVVVVVCYSFL